MRLIAALAGFFVETEDTPKSPQPLSNGIPIRPVVVAPKRGGETKRTHVVEESKPDLAWTRYFSGVLS